MLVYEAKIVTSVAPQDDIWRILTTTGVLLQGFAKIKCISIFLSIPFLPKIYLLTWRRGARLAIIKVKESHI